MTEKTAARPSLKQSLFGNFDFDAIPANRDFKEDSVRAVIIDPVLRELGYTPETIVRSKTLLHPILKTGTAKRPVTLIPDYLLKVEESFAWTLDAKSPPQSVLDADNVEQVYSYAVHREIRSVYFALCNGIEFSLFRTTAPGSPILYFRVPEIDAYWTTLHLLLAPGSFQEGKQFSYPPPPPRAYRQDGRNIRLQQPPSFGRNSGKKARSKTAFRRSRLFYPPDMECS